MQVFVPYSTPINVAKCLDKRRLLKQIAECDQIIAAIKGDSKGWSGHPVVKMYREHLIWLGTYRQCLYAYSKGRIEEAMVYNVDACECEPPFLNESFCDQHKRRLYTKSPTLYPQFASYGTSEENWYVVDGMVIIYVNGKQTKAFPESWLQTNYPLKDLKAMTEKLKQHKVNP